MCKNSSPTIQNGVMIEASDVYHHLLIVTKLEHGVAVKSFYMKRQPLVMTPVISMTFEYLQSRNVW